MKITIQAHISLVKAHRAGLTTPDEGTLRTFQALKSIISVTAINFSPLESFAELTVEAEVSPPLAEVEPRIRQVLKDLGYDPGTLDIQAANQTSPWTDEVIDRARQIGR